MRLCLSALIPSIRCYYCCSLGHNAFCCESLPSPCALQFPRNCDLLIILTKHARSPFQRLSAILSISGVPWPSLSPPFRPPLLGFAFTFPLHAYKLSLLRSQDKQGTNRQCWYVLLKFSNHLIIALQCMILSRTIHYILCIHCMHYIHLMWKEWIESLVTTCSHSHGLVACIKIRTLQCIDT